VVGMTPGVVAAHAELHRSFVGSPPLSRRTPLPKDDSGFGEFPRMASTALCHPSQTHKYSAVILNVVFRPALPEGSE
jgi:hypothetical protein